MRKRRLCSCAPGGIFACSPRTVRPTQGVMSSFARAALPGHLRTSTFLLARGTDRTPSTHSIFEARRWFTSTSTGQAPHGERESKVYKRMREYEDGLVRIINHSFMAERLRAMPHLSVTYCGERLAQVDQAEDPLLYLSLLQDLAMLYWREHKWEEAMRKFQLQLETLRRMEGESNNPKLVAQIHKCLINVLTCMGAMRDVHQADTAKEVIHMEALAMKKLGLELEAAAAGGEEKKEQGKEKNADKEEDRDEQRKQDEAKTIERLVKSVVRPLSADTAQLRARRFADGMPRLPYLHIDWLHGLATKPKADGHRCEVLGTALQAYADNMLPLDEWTRHSPDELEYEFRLYSTMYFIKKNLNKLQPARDAIQYALISLLHTPAVHYQNLMVFAHEHMHLSAAISDNHNAWRFQQVIASGLFVIARKNPSDAARNALRDTVRNLLKLLDESSLSSEEKDQRSSGWKNRMKDAYPQLCPEGEFI